MQSAPDPPVVKDKRFVPKRRKPKVHVDSNGAANNIVEFVDTKGRVAFTGKYTDSNVNNVMTFPNFSPSIRTKLVQSQPNAAGQRKVQVVCHAPFEAIKTTAKAMDTLMRQPSNATDRSVLALKPTQLVHQILTCLDCDHPEAKARCDEARDAMFDKNVPLPAVNQLLKDAKALENVKLPAAHRSDISDIVEDMTGTMAAYVQHFKPASLVKDHPVSTIVDILVNENFGAASDNPNAVKVQRSRLACELRASASLEEEAVGTGGGAGGGAGASHSRRRVITREQLQQAFAKVVVLEPKYALMCLQTAISAEMAELRQLASNTVGQNFANVPKDTFRTVDIGPQHMCGIASSPAVKVPNETLIFIAICAYIDGHRATLTDDDIRGLMNCVKGLWLDEDGFMDACMFKPRPEWLDIVMAARSMRSDKLHKYITGLEQSTPARVLIAQQLTPRVGYKQAWEHVAEEMGVRVGAPSDAEVAAADGGASSDGDSHQESKEKEATDGKVPAAAEGDIDVLTEDPDANKKSQASAEESPKKADA